MEQKPTGLNIERVHLDQLTEDPRNARRHPERNLKAIAGSLKRFGQAEPLVVQESTGKVIGGNGRLAVMRKLGWSEADVVRLDVDDKTATALGLALNRAAETAEWDEEGLAKLLREVGELSVDCGWDEKELDKLIGDAEIDLGTGEIDEKPEMRQLLVFLPSNAAKAVTDSIKQLVEDAGGVVVKK